MNSVTSKWLVLNFQFCPPVAGFECPLTVEAIKVRQVQGHQNILKAAKPPHRKAARQFAAAPWFASIRVHHFRLVISI
jgi:hypothetical protein